MTFRTSLARSFFVRGTLGGFAGWLWGGLLGGPIAAGVALLVLPGGCSPGPASGVPVDAGARMRSNPSCGECATARDCAFGDACVIVQGLAFCARPCPLGDECNPGSTCSSEMTTDGDGVPVCLATLDVGSCDGGACQGDGSSNCATLAAPASVATCHGCEADAGRCQPNGCASGLWCELSEFVCKPAPSACLGAAGCSAASGPGTLVVDAGTPVTGAVGSDGGSVSRLLFAIVGDTRPPNVDDTSAYPTTIINQIYDDIAAFRPAPSFVVSTGDYEYASPDGGQSAPQIELYLSARRRFPGAFFPVMGNHECTGAVTSNCGLGNADGVTTNFENFVRLMLGPIGQKAPYYAVDVDATDGAWTSKFIFLAANAWDAGQAAWLERLIARKTTYTFVVRHEPRGTVYAPGAQPSDTILARVPYTLMIDGHLHYYEHRSDNEVLMGNGGAPPTGTTNYGYGLVSQRSDGALVVDAIDYQTGLADASFHFVVTAEGKLTQ